MKPYNVCKPVHTPTSPGYFRVHFVPVGLVQAYSPEHAIRLAKKIGYFCPIVEPTKEHQQ